MRIVGTRQSEILAQVLKYDRRYNAAGTGLQTGTYILKQKGICAALAAYYLKNKVKENGDFWSWIKDHDHKFEVMSPYLNDDYRMLTAAQATGKVDTFLRQHFQYVRTDPVAGNDYNAVGLYSALTQTRDRGIARYCHFIGGPNQTSHAVGFVYHAKPRLFDPDYNEWIFDNEGQLYDFLRALWSLYSRYQSANVFFYI